MGSSSICQGVTAALSWLLCFPGGLLPPVRAVKLVTLRHSSVRPGEWTFRDLLHGARRDHRRDGGVTGVRLASGGRPDGMCGMCGMPRARCSDRSRAGLPADTVRPAGPGPRADVGRGIAVGAETGADAGERCAGRAVAPVEEAVGAPGAPVTGRSPLELVRRWCAVSGVATRARRGFFFPLSVCAVSIRGSHRRARPVVRAGLNLSSLSRCVCYSSRSESGAGGSLKWVE